MDRFDRERPEKRLNPENQGNPLDSDFSSQLKRHAGSDGAAAFDGLKLGNLAGHGPKPLPPDVTIIDGEEWESIAPGERLPGEPENHTARFIGPKGEEIFIPLDESYRPMVIDRCFYLGKLKDGTAVKLVPDLSDPDNHEKFLPLYPDGQSRKPPAAETGAPPPRPEGFWSESEPEEFRRPARYRDWRKPPTPRD
jgi:hypothetical protein